MIKQYSYPSYNVHLAIIMLSQGSLLCLFIFNLTTWIVAMYGVLTTRRLYIYQIFAVSLVPLQNFLNLPNVQDRFNQNKQIKGLLENSKYWPFHPFLSTALVFFCGATSVWHIISLAMEGEKSNGRMEKNGDIIAHLIPNLAHIMTWPVRISGNENK